MFLLSSIEVFPSIIDPVQGLLCFETDSFRSKYHLTSQWALLDHNSTLYQSNQVLCRQNLAHLFPVNFGNQQNASDEPLRLCYTFYIKFFLSLVMLAGFHFLKRLMQSCNINAKKWQRPHTLLSFIVRNFVWQVVINVLLAIQKLAPMANLGPRLILEDKSKVQLL